MIHAGFLLNIPAKGNRGAKEALRRQPNWLGKLVPERFAERVAMKLPPRSCYFRPKLIKFADGVEVQVHILGIPATSAALIDQDHRFYKEANQRLIAGPSVLREIAGTDISVLGLGAATAIAGRHGDRIYKQYKGEIPVVTNGNTITAALAVEIGKKAHWLISGDRCRHIGVVGGFGSVGSRIVSMAIEQFRPESVLIATGHDRNHDKQLQAVRGRYPDTDIDIVSLRAVVAFPLVFLTTSSVEALEIETRWPAKNAIWLDVGKPLNTSPELLRARQDLVVIDGSLALLPDGTDWVKPCYRMGLPPNTVFGCLAETITLAHLYASGRLSDQIGKSTFIGKPDERLVHRMVGEMTAIGLSPAVISAHR